MSNDDVFVAVLDDNLDLVTDDVRPFKLKTPKNRFVAEEEDVVVVVFVASDPS